MPVAAGNDPKTARGSPFARGATQAGAVAKFPMRPRPAAEGRGPRRWASEAWPRAGHKPGIPSRGGQAGRRLAPSVRGRPRWRLSRTATPTQPCPCSHAHAAVPMQPSMRPRPIGTPRSHPHRFRPARGSELCSIRNAHVTVRSLRRAAWGSNPPAPALRGHHAGFTPGRACARRENGYQLRFDQFSFPVQLLQPRVQLAVMLGQPIHLGL